MEEATAQTHLPERWIERICSMMEIPVNHEIMRFFKAWQQSEGGSARWNPLNVTDHVSSQASGNWQGTDYNSIGVCNYNHAWQGILATIDTMKQAVFSNLIVALRDAKASGETAEQLVENNRTLIKQWGTSPDTMLSVLQNIS